MRTKLMAILFAAVLMMALPSVALALESPNGSDSVPENYTGTKVVGSNSITENGLKTVTLKGDVYENGKAVKENVDYFSVTVKEGTDLVVEEANNTKANNYVEREYVSVNTFKVESGNYNKGDVVTIAYYAGEKSTGLTCYIFVQHSDGTNETFVKEVGRDGVVNFDMKNLSFITFAVDKTPYQSSTDTDKDSTGKKSSSSSSNVKAKDSSSKSPKTGGIL